MNKVYLNDGEKGFFVSPHDRESLFTTSSEYSLNSRYSHAIYHISCQPKWNLYLWTQASYI